MQSITHRRVSVIMYLIIIFMFVWMLASSFRVAFMLRNRGNTFCSICVPHATSVFQTPRPISFHSNCIQSQPLFLLINTGVSLNLHRRTRIHLDGCISWGDPGGSHVVTDEERWWANNCWSDSLDFLSQFCNHTKTGTNHYSFIFILTNQTVHVPRKRVWRDSEPLRSGIVVHRWVVGCVCPVGLCDGLTSTDFL